MASRKTAKPADVATSTGYTVLARRYRSRDFDELIGQEPIARTLKNAIATGRTAHAYLFCGTRGVGKTSMARIFAKALNVSDDLSEKDRIAEAILRGDDLDVIEIDGASNRGIADAKELIAGASLSPARCTYKIYIIDEVHMLTREAFNALLKTMEEPPSHVKFILCTTEAHKVPPTIQSRCQRFDFRPIPAARIAEQLRMILTKEKIDADDEVIVQVAQLGNGSMRDALSMLDRLLAAGEKRLTSELLEEMVGLPDQSLILALVDAVIAGDAAAALKRADDLIQRGSPVEQILELLANHLRNLLVINACGNETDLVELSAEARRVAEMQAKQFDTAGLVHLIAICDAVARNARNSSAARALFDAAVARMALSERFADVTAVLRGDGAAGDGRTAGAATTRQTGKKKELSGPASDSALARAPNAPSRTDAASTPRPSSNRLAEPKRLDASPKASPSFAGDDDQAGRAIWDAVLSAANDQESVRAKVDHLAYDSFDGRQMRLSVDEEGRGIARYLSTQTGFLARLVKQLTGRTVTIDVIAPSAATSEQVSVDNDELEAVSGLPIVREAIDLFDATIVGVEDSPAAPPAGQEDWKEQHDV